MKLFYFLIYLYLILKPYYFWESGTLQIGDMFLVLAFGLFLLFSLRKKSIINENVKKNKYYAYFLIMVIIINFIYYFTNNDKTFMISSLYYIFNFIIIVLFSFLLDDYKFINGMNKIMKINLIIQLFLCVFGIGKQWKGTFRYSGTFNDPNQFSYFILISYCYIYIFAQKFECKNNIFLYLIISLYLIIRSSSTGMLLGIFVFIILELLNNFRNLPIFLKKNTKKIFISIYFISLIVIILELYFMINPNKKDNLMNNFKDIKIFKRITEKINKTENEKDNDLWRDRGYDIIFASPSYLIYGAGQGGYGRSIPIIGHGGEIHATFPSILFYYGFFPTIVLIYWIYLKLKKIDLDVLIVYIALLAESFTLLNQRQALFWIIILLGNNIKMKKGYKK